MSKFTCPMHPEVVSDQPSDCPKCGMALEPKTVTAGMDDEENAERPVPVELRIRFVG